MFLAYVKNNVDERKIDTITFTEQKQSYINRLVLLEQSIKGKDWFNIKGTRLCFHKQWLDCLNEVTSDIGICFFATVTGTYGRITVRRHGSAYDIETDQRISTRISMSYFGSGVDNYTDPSINGGRSEEYYFTCLKCNRREHITNRYTNGEMYCYDCYTKYSIECNKCGRRFIPLKSEKICNECLSNTHTCEICGTELSDYDFVVSGKHYCKKHYSELKKENKIETCTMCGTEFFKEDKELTKRNDGNVCKPCLFSIQTNTGIRNYTYKPNPIFYGDQFIDPLYMGVELEILTPSTRDNLSRYLQFNVNKNDDFCYCKRDSSIGTGDGSGFEIVTHPFTFEWMKSDAGKEVFKKIFDLKLYNCESFYSNTCGMHVHMNKTAFTTVHLYKFLHMIFNNKSFSLLISERTDMQKVERYCNFKPQYNIKQLAYRKTNGDGENRHKAVNLNCSPTVEVRIFRGTLEYERFMKNIEYCKSLYEFTKNCSIKDLSIKKYLEFVKDNHKTYKNLFDFLKSKGEL